MPFHGLASGVETRNEAGRMLGTGTGWRVGSRHGAVLIMLLGILSLGVPVSRASEVDVQSRGCTEGSGGGMGGELFGHIYASGAQSRTDKPGKAPIHAVLEPNRFGADSR